MKVGIIGASGYTGAELLRLLNCHPEAEVTYITAHTYVGAPVQELYPHLHHYAGLEFQEFSPEEARREAEFFFVTLPHGESMKVVPMLIEGGSEVVDLSADYRLPDPQIYERWYGLKHTSPHLLTEAVYGLPEVYYDAIANARLVGAPGCYPTAAILALAPLADNAISLEEPLIIDAKSGISGAGRSLSLTTHYAQADANVKPYNVGAHRHTPEIEGILSSLQGQKASVVFTPHLVPMSRGILATCYVKVASGLPAAELESLYRSFYAESQFVVITGEGCFPETKAVTGSNYCHIGWFLDIEKDLLIVASAIDNLVKGASGQAVQCMNVMNGWDEGMGLKSLGIFP